MNIYELSSFLYDEKTCEEDYTIMYVTHEKLFTQDEFNSICNEGLENILDKNAYELERFLFLNYGFKPLSPSIKFEFQEEE